MRGKVIEKLRMYCCHCVEKVLRIKVINFQSHKFFLETKLDSL